MDRDEAAEVKQWFMAYSRTLRMEYGMAMALAGFSEDVIVEVQQAVAVNMIDWLKRVS